jgi:superfamily I DNA and/or RNA helicase/very-short-patch-repair endonuclease
MPNFNEIKANAINIFKYLEELFSLNVDARRDFRVLAEQEWMREVRNFPESENIFVKKLNDSSDDPDLFLFVQKKEIDPLPKLPKELIEWVDLGNIGFSKPEYKEFLFKKVRFSDDDKRVKEFKELVKSESKNTPRALQGWVTKDEKGGLNKIDEREVKFLFTDFPELQEMYDNYIIGPWEEWRKKNEPIFKANQVYDDLYGLRTFLKTEKENFDLLWTHDVLTWKKENEKIYHPLFITPVTLEFFPEERKIELRKDSTLKTIFETSFLEALDIPNILDIHEESRTLNSEEYDVWNRAALKLKGGEIVGYLSQNGVEKLSDDIPEPEITDVPAYWFFPTILLRKKSNIDWAKYAKKIQQDINQNEVLPPFIIELSGGEDSQDEKDLERGDTSIPDGELYFPLPWNDEQKQIANKIEARYGVVVQGPPGTGKSHTIANLLSRFLAQGKSVLVTSQTGKALEVLKNKIPQEIRDLVVSQVESNSRHDDLQTSVTTINANLDDTTKFTDKRIEKIKEQLKEIRKEKAALLSRIKKWVLLDVEEKLLIDGDHLTPTKAAKELSEGRKKNQLWLRDKIAKDIELNFTEEDVTAVSELLACLTKDERRYFEQWLPETKYLPRIEEAENFFEQYKESFSLKKEWEKYLAQKKPKKTPVFEEEKVRPALKKVSEARDVLNSIDKKWESKLFVLILKNKEENEKWQNGIFERLKEKSTQIRQLENDLLGYDISHNTNLTTKDLLVAINEIEKKLENRSSLGWLQKLGLSKKAKDILQNISVQSSNVGEKEAVLLLKKKIGREQKIDEIRVLWNQGFEQSDISNFEELENPFVLHKLEDRLKSMKRILDYEDNFREISQFIEQNPIFSEFVYTDKKSIEKFIAILEALLASFDLDEYEKIFTSWKEELNSDNGHSVAANICLAIDNRDSTTLKNLYQQLSELRQKKRDSEKLQELKEKIISFAPKLYGEVQEEMDDDGKYQIPGNLPVAWRLARISNWLEEIHSDKSVAELHEELGRVEHRESDKESELIATTAWKNQKAKVTRPQRQALAAYAKSVKKIGKGSGKYAPHWRKEAQKALQEAKDAVPIWIMPLGKVLHMFSEPKAGMFDVVIFDESSQVDVRGVNIAYLGKKVLVVGDPEQISPTSFINQEDVIGLITKHLSNIRHSQQFSVTSSLFDIAEVMMTDRVMLLEHFRSVEEVISFSNKLSYDGRLKILRYPHPKWQLKPTLEAIHIENGFMNVNNQANEPEAEAVVDKLVELLHNPKYEERDDERGGTRPTTFGVVTLLGNDQGKFITDLIRQKVSEEDVEKRKIIAGNPYAFQGDERDVMLISLVKAPDQNDIEKSITPLTINKKENKQRVNVAMSRARDKEILFHSFLREELTNENDLRAQMLDWFYNPQKEEIKWGREALQEELNKGRASQFEVDVGNIILNNGYKVIPQFEVAGYRIDLVIQGENARIAVECDGDQYHGPDRWADDLERENILRRAGWEFWRITGSAFYKHEEDALKPLWVKLREMEIEPIV